MSDEDCEGPTPELFAEWGEGGRLDYERWVTAHLMGWTWMGFILGGLRGDCLEMRDFDRGVWEGLQRAIDLLRNHRETVSNHPPFRYLKAKNASGADGDLTNSTFIERLEEMRDAV